MCRCTPHRQDFTELSNWQTDLATVTNSDQTMSSMFFVDQDDVQRSSPMRGAESDDSGDVEMDDIAVQRARRRMAIKRKRLSKFRIPTPTKKLKK